MTRLTIDLPESLHKVLKSLSVVDGKTMRGVAISALEKYAQSRIGKKIKTQGSNSITENEIDELLKPLMLQYVNQINEGSFEGKDWEEVKKEI